MAIITVSSTADSGKGTLREAILQAKSGDTIRFNSSLANKTIKLKEQLVVDKSLTIDGADADNLTISGENKTRILRVSYDYSDVVLRNLAFANGKAVDNDSSKTQRGGAIELVDSNTLVVENSQFIDNVGERGGAIFVGYGSQATVINSVFDGNDGSVANDGFSAGAISTYGGGEKAKVVNSNGKRNVGGDAFLDIRDSTFTNNKGTYGAVYTLLTNLKVEDSEFRNNEGVDGSGAIFTDGANGTEKRDTVGGTTLIRNVVAEGNTGGGDYGGAFFLSGYSKDKIVIENSKIVNNKARRGGGLAVQSYRDEENPAKLIIRDSTITDNTSTSQGGGLWTDVKGGVTIEDSTFSGNRIENSKNSGIGGAIVLNYKRAAKSTITNSTFVDNYAGDQAGSIWIAGKQQAKNLTISKSEFADNRSSNKELENTVNYKVTNGGGNVVQNINGTDSGIAGAKLVDDLQLNSVPQNEDNPVTNPVSEPPKDIVNPEPEPISTPSNNQPLRYEAEELTLDGYKVEIVKNSSASAGKHISLKGVSENKGEAKGTFEGEAGIYQVKVGYYDENDGQSKAKITVAGESTSFTFDKDLPDGWVKPASKTSRIAIEEVQLESGDTFKIEATSNKGEFARFDYIEFSPISSQTTSAPTPQTPMVRAEGEENTVINRIVNLSKVDFDGDGEVDEKVSLILDDINSTASYSNSAGFYQVLDVDGTVLDPVTNQQIQPGEKGYETAAFNQRITELEFDRDDSTLTAEVDGGIFLAPYLIANGTVEEFIGENPNNNKSGSGLNAYFAFGNANPDGVEHLKSSDNNFGFEDMYGGGDRDFTDITFSVNVESV